MMIIRPHDTKACRSFRAHTLLLSTLLLVALALAGCKTNRGHSKGNPIAQSNEDSVDYGTAAAVKRGADTGTSPQDFDAPRDNQDELEPGICRMGSDFRVIRGEQASPSSCRDICDRLMDCMSFTYIAGSAEDDAARCELKHSVPPPVEDDPSAPLGCVSWVNPRAERQLALLAEQGFELNSERPGESLREFALDRPDPALCQTACRNLEDCAAFTYFRPENTDGKAHCALKTQALPPAEERDCCISGLK